MKEIAVSPVDEVSVPTLFRLDEVRHAPSRKERFLRSLKSSGKQDYKRYLGSPLRYAGGKSLAVGYVVERLPKGLRRLVSPFLGGGMELLLDNIQERRNYDEMILVYGSAIKTFGNW